MVNRYGNKLLILDKDTLEFKVEALEDIAVGYEQIHEGVEGYIERVSYNRKLYINRIDTWVNEEGKIEGLKPSVVVINGDKQVVEILHGNLVFTKNDAAGNSFGLTDLDIKIIMEEFTGKVDFDMVAIECNENRKPIKKPPMSMTARILHMI